MSEPNITTSRHPIQGTQGEIAKKFLKKLTKGMCEGSMLYFDKYHSIEPWHPLTYNERSMYALLSAAAANISPAILSEIPLRRHSKRTSGYSKDGQPGRLDLWINLNKNCDVFLELKRVSVGLGKLKEKSEPSGKFESSWSGPNGVVKQAEALTKVIKGWSKDNIPVGLLVVYGYISSKKNLNRPPSDNECDGYRNKLKCLIDKLDTKPDWYAYWIPPKNMRKLDNEINPVIAFIAFIGKK